MHPFRYPVFFAAFVLLAGCHLAPAALSIREDQPAPWPTHDWPKATLQEVELDPEPLADLVEQLRANREIRNIHSLLIVRGGYLVLEEYFNGSSADDLHTLQSVSKSFSSALVGIAIEQGHIKGVDERVLDFFDDHDAFENIDDLKRSMRIEDLLTMRSGTDYHERGPGSPHYTLNAMRTGWTEFILSRAMVSEPGTNFNYDSGAVILMSGLIKQRTGAHADVLAAEHLFKPLGITRTRWFRNGEDHPHLGGGLDLRARDMAKFGLLYMRKGRWEDKQVVPQAWVESSLKRHVEFDRPRGRSVGYGYWWWVLPPGSSDIEGSDDVVDQQDIYGAFGFMGQYIFLIPEHDMVVIVTAGGKGWSEEKAPRDFLYTHILPSVARE